MRKHDEEDIVTMASGARASACHDYTGIPLSALDAIATRQALGASKHGRDNYRQGLSDPEYIRARLSHIIRHSFALAEKLDGREPWGEDDDIGAIAWGAMFLAEARKASPKVFCEHATKPRGELVTQLECFGITYQLRNARRSSDDCYTCSEFRHKYANGGFSSWLNGDAASFTFATNIHQVTI